MDHLKEKPFVLIGVNAWNSDPDKLKRVMTKEKLNWRSFADDGTINRQWNSPPTPAYYVIDHQGIIRKKWIGYPGKKSLDIILGKWIEEAERAAEAK